MSTLVLVLLSFIEAYNPIGFCTAELIVYSLTSPSVRPSSRGRRTILDHEEHLLPCSVYFVKKYAGVNLRDVIKVFLWVLKSKERK